MWFRLEHLAGVGVSTFPGPRITNASELIAMEQLTQSPRPNDRPFRKVIVGVDEQQGGRDAVALAADLIAPDGSVLFVTVHVQDLLVGRSSSPDLTAVERSQAVRSPAPAVSGSAHEGAGQPVRIDSTSVGRGLHEFAESERADLLVVGSCRRGLFGRVMVGSDTGDALNAAPCAVAIAPFGYAEHPAPVVEIGVAYNGSAESREALAVARALAAQHGARVSAFEAVAVPASLAFPGAGAVSVLPELIDRARARITALGDVEPHAAYGMPAEELALYSASLSLLIVGSRGYGPFGRLVHGSTSRQLGRTARCALLVLTRRAPALPQPAPDQHTVAAHELGTVSSS
jgi:nucleotide-binding universal stress UspA family protein